MPKGDTVSKARVLLFSMLAVLCGYAVGNVQGRLLRTGQNPDTHPQSFNSWRHSLGFPCRRCRCDVAGDDLWACTIWMGGGWGHGGSVWEVTCDKRTCAITRVWGGH